MAAGRLPAGAAGGWSERAVLVPGLLLLCGEESEPRVLPAARPRKGKPGPTRAPARPGTHGNQSFCRSSGGKDFAHRPGPAVRPPSRAYPDSVTFYIKRRGFSPPPDSHWLEEPLLGGPCHASRRPRPELRPLDPGPRRRLWVLLWGEMFGTFQGAGSSCTRLRFRPGSVQA